MENSLQPGYTFTQPYHKAPYPAISPLRPELSQEKKTVLITGGSAGIGLAISRAFLQASAARVIILGRQRETTETAAAQLRRETRDANPDAEIVSRPCDMSDPEEVEALWDDLADQGHVVDALVLNAAAIAPAKPILEVGTETIWKDYVMNAREQMHMAERFYKQQGKGVDATKYLVHISTSAIHYWDLAAAYPGYGLTKNAGALVLQTIAKDTPPEKLQIVNMNPGPVLTRAARGAGYTENDFAWNDPNLPGQLAVWLASPEARFLHGRFVWAEWDVDQLKTGELRKRIDEDPSYLKVGVRGL